MGGVKYSGGSPEQLKSAREFAIELARLAANTRCHNVVILDLAGVTPVADYFVLCTGTSARQMRTVCDEAEELAEKLGNKPFTRSGYEGESWIVEDFIDVVLHVFNQETRMYYDLDNLWGDAKRLEWRQEEPAGAAK